MTAVPRHILALACVYFWASLIHFSHNAEFIAIYPGMPQWLTRETVYLAWLGVCTVGALALLAARFKHAFVAALAFAAYGALGIDGLAHYTLALCSEHSLGANLTIWFEVLMGAALLFASALWATQIAQGRFRPKAL